MAFTGAWRDARTTRVDGSSYTDPPAKFGAPELSAEHMDITADVNGSRPPWAVVHEGEVPAWLTDGEATYASPPGRGLVLDVENDTDHRLGTVGSGHQSAAQARAQGHAARTVDRGAQDRQLYRAPRYRANDEVRTTEMYVLEPTSSGSRKAALRGDNSLPENNPDGFRVGQRVRRWQDRKIPGGGLRRHNAHPLHLHVAAAPHVSPEPANGTGNRYASPFSLNISSRTRVLQMPVARRSPRPWDDDVVTDATGGPAPEYVVWGL